MVEAKFFFSPILALLFFVLVNETHKIISDAAGALFRLSKPTARYRGFLKNHIAARALLLRENSFSIAKSRWLAIPMAILLLMAQMIPPITTVTNAGIILPITIFLCLVLLYFASYAFQIWKKDRTTSQLLHVFDVERAGFIVCIVLPIFFSVLIATHSSTIVLAADKQLPVFKAPVLILGFLVAVFSLPYVSISWNLADIAEGNRRILVRWFEIAWVAFAVYMFWGVWLYEAEAQFIELTIKTLFVLFLKDVVSLLIPAARKRELMYKGMYVLAPISIGTLLLSILWGWAL